MKKEKTLEKSNKQIQENESGASMLEYALLAALIAVVCIAAVTFLGQQASESFSGIANSLQDQN